MNFFTRAGVALASFVWAFSLFAQDSGVQIARLQELLRQIDEGINPCFTEECQLQKSAALTEIFKAADLIPFTGERILPSRISAIESARFMVNYPYQRPSDEFPQTLKEWMGWWEKRYSREAQHRFAWESFQSESLGAYQALDLFINRLSQASDGESALIQEAWNRGSGIIGRLLRDQQIAKARGDSALASTLRDQRIKYETDFQGVYREVMEELFPGIEFKLIVPMQDYLLSFSDGFKTHQITSPFFLKKITSLRKSFKKLNSLIQNFNDLEVGRVGLKNFNSLTNPAVATELELIIQGFLDKVDESGRTAAFILGLYFLTNTASIATDAKLIQIAFPGIVNIAMEYHDFDFTQKIWAASHRTHTLDSSIDELRKEAEERWLNLLRVRKVLTSKITELQSTQGEPQP